MSQCLTTESVRMVPRAWRAHGGPSSRRCKATSRERQGSYWERSKRLRGGHFRRDFPPPTEGLIDGHESSGGACFTVSELILGFQEGAFGVLKAGPRRGLDRIRGQACLRLIGEASGHRQWRRFVIRPDQH